MKCLYTNKQKFEKTKQSNEPVVNTNESNQNNESNKSNKSIQPHSRLRRVRQTLLCNTKRNGEKDRRSNLSSSFIYKSAFPCDQNDIDGIRQWLDHIRHTLLEPRLEQLADDPESLDPKEILAGFLCRQCQTQSHPCFICGLITDIPTSQCIYTAKGCGKYYHLQCLTTGGYELHSTIYKELGIDYLITFVYNYYKYIYIYSRTFVCPRHHCWDCTKSSGAPKRQCWYCPQMYCRKHCPPIAELPAVQVAHSGKDYGSYPDFKFDLINCRPGMNARHPLTRDLEFGRNDSKFGVLSNIQWAVHEALRVQLHIQLRQIPQYFEYSHPIDVTAEIVEKRISQM
ncbi:hypothetical protein RFI_23984, partial [Reticulomyxa filosa]